MIKEFLNRILRVFGLQVTRIPEPTQSTPTQSADQSQEIPETQSPEKIDYLGALIKEPLNPELHLNFAIQAFEHGQPYLAFSELKTAEYLGVNSDRSGKYFDSFKQALPEQKTMNHNQFFRFSSLSSEIIKRGGISGFSILDVGGGEGWLASYVPEISYCLAEPNINGISGTNLPFGDNSFDYVVACHVLEHIPMSEREAFLDQLLSKAKRGVILLNPFHIESTLVTERLNLILEITGEEWAKEHLECTLPKIQDIKDYARNKRLELEIKPNGTLTTSLAFVFVDYFAAKSGLYGSDDWKKLNAFYNIKYLDILDSPEYPNAYLIYFGKPEE
jgi:2-polyprenyl-3-methyl-5-hydroxy-6-metoxy-1,4-benzoquinol methylase